MTCLLEIRDIRLTYAGGVRALDGVNLSIGRELLGLLGPNGAGKTTLLRLLARRLRPQTGTATLMNIPLSRPGLRVSWLEHLSYLPQEETPPRNLTGREAIATALALARPEWPRPLRVSATEKALDKVGLTDCADRRAIEYSGGMRRRLGLARALASAPSLLLVDEPTSGLDPQERVAFRELLSRVAEVAAVIISTHITADVEVSCARVVVLYQGRVIWDGTPSELIRNSLSRTFQAEVGQAELDSFLAARHVTAVIPEERRFRVRYLAEPQAPGPGEPCTPTLEEAYLDLIARPGAIEEGQR